MDKRRAKKQRNGLRKNLSLNVATYRGICFLCKRIKVGNLLINRRPFNGIPKHTSLKDLAQALGVSIPTVSQALKDSPEISREFCAKAKQLAKDMNYRPNPFAMSLRKNAPRIIGVVVPT